MGRKINVLLADNSEYFAIPCANVMKSHGLDVTMSEKDGQAVVEAITRQLPDVVLMDPPRAGSDKAFLSSVVKMGPEKVVYISCNPETLARDVDWLEKNGYKAQGVWPVDMFPHTSHAEAVTLLVKTR